MTGLECVRDIALVLDSSGSIRDNDPPGTDNWQLILNFVKSIVQSFNIGSAGVRVAAVYFGTS